MNIQRCLESVSFASEIIVLDSGSTDDTVAIARQYTDRVYETDWQGYGIQKQRALSYATQPWVLNLDADEVVSEALKKELDRVIGSESVDACRIPIHMHFQGHSLKFSASPSRHVRCFRREKGQYSHDIVHEKILLSKDACVVQLKSPLIHYSLRDLSHAIEKMNRYSSYSAKIRLTHQKKPQFGGVCLSTIWMFLRCYVFQGGFLEGRVGFLFAVLQAQGSFFRGMKQLYPDVHVATLPHVEPH